MQAVRPGRRRLQRTRFLRDAITLGKEQDVPPLAPATEERHRRFLVAFFNHLVNGQAIASSPMKAFRKPKEDHAIDPDKAIRLFEDG